MAEGTGAHVHCHLVFLITNPVASAASPQAEADSKTAFSICWIPRQPSTRGVVGFDKPPETLEKLFEASDATPAFLPEQL
jgi:hypothetical protein